MYERKSLAWEDHVTANARLSKLTLCTITGSQEPENSRCKDLNSLADVTPLAESTLVYVPLAVNAQAQMSAFHPCLRPDICRICADICHVMCPTEISNGVCLFVCLFVFA